MLEFLPPGAAIDIVARLPTKNIIQCTCVCKSWYSLITNPSFITALHNRLALTTNHHRLILIRTSGYRSEEHFSLYSDHEKSLTQYAKLGFPFRVSRNSSFRIIGCCNGLICLSTDLSRYQDQFYLWNPLIQKMMTLPPFRVTLQSHGAFMHSIGFGFDPLTDDYKVVRIVYVSNCDGSICVETRPPEVDVISLNSGVWRNIRHHLGCFISKERAPQVYVKGAAHWIAMDASNQSLILRFDMGNEVFDKILVPANMGASELHLLDVCLAKFEDSLALIQHHTTRRGGDSCCIWVRKEYGAEGSRWSKQFSIGMEVRFKCVGVRREGEVLVATRSGTLMSFDPRVDTDQFKELLSFKIPDYYGFSWYKNFFVDAYTESLVLLGNRFCEMVKSEVSFVLH